MRDKHIMIFGIDYLHQLQWPAMVVTVLASWLIAYQAKSERRGFAGVAVALHLSR